MKRSGFSSEFFQLKKKFQRSFSCWSLLLNDDEPLEQSIASNEQKIIRFK